MQGEVIAKTLTAFWKAHVVPAISTQTLYMFTDMMLRFVRVQRLKPSHVWGNSNDYSEENPFFLSQFAHSDSETLRVSLDVSGFGEEAGERKGSELWEMAARLMRKRPPDASKGNLMEMRGVLMVELNRAIGKLKPHPGDSTAVELVVGAVFELFVALVQVLNYNGRASATFLDTLPLDSLYALFVSSLGNTGEAVLKAMEVMRKALGELVPAAKAANWRAHKKYRNRDRADTYDGMGSEKLFDEKQVPLE